MKKNAILAAALAAVSFVSGAAGWSHNGHGLVAGLAAQMLSPGEKEVAESVIGSKVTLQDLLQKPFLQPRGEDESKLRTLLPVGAEKFNARDCASGGLCIIEGIRGQLEQVRADPRQAFLCLSHSTTSDCALLSLVKFVSDIHQPLHVGFECDNGGVEVNTSFFGVATSLDRVWSDLILDKWQRHRGNAMSELESMSAADPSLVSLFANQMAVEEWAAESFGYVLTHVYNFTGRLDNEPSCGHRQGANKAMLAGQSTSVLVDYAYYNRNLPLIQRRLIGASIRLGMLLKSALDSVNRTQMPAHTHGRRGTCSGSRQLELRVSSAGDDGEQPSLTGSNDCTSSDLEMMYDEGTQKAVGMLFHGFNVDTTSEVVTNAFLVFQDDTEDASTMTTSLSISIENATTPSNCYGSLYTSRSLVSLQVSWNLIPYWEAPQQERTSPDVSEALNALLASHSSWFDGTARDVSVIITGTGKRTVHAYDNAGNALWVPMLKLNIDCQDQAVSSSNSTTALNSTLSTSSSTSALSFGSTTSSTSSGISGSITAATNSMTASSTVLGSSLSSLSSTFQGSVTSTDASTFLLPNNQTSTNELVTGSVSSTSHVSASSAVSNVPAAVESSFMPFLVLVVVLAALCCGCLFIGGLLVARHYLHKKEDVESSSLSREYHLPEVVFQSGLSISTSPNSDTFAAKQVIGVPGREASVTSLGPHTTYLPFQGGCKLNGTESPASLLTNTYMPFNVGSALIAEGEKVVGTDNSPILAKIESTQSGLKTSKMPSYSHMPMIPSSQKKPIATPNKFSQPATPLIETAPLGSRSSLANSSNSSISSCSLKLLNAQDLKFGEELGGGAFGLVYKGKHRGGKVAIKVLREEKFSQAQWDEFVAEAEIMSSISPHPNVVQMIGIAVPNGELASPAIVTQFLAAGDLESKLFSTDSTIIAKITDREVVDELIHGIAAGCYHIASEGVVHRDLAARNVLLTSDWTPKISDLGLSRVLKRGEDQHTKADTGPIRWMCPSALINRRYSEATDIWAFAILVGLELLRREVPYKDLDNIAVASGVASGRLTPVTFLDAGTPDPLCGLLSWCFEFEPENRPTFAEVLGVLDGSLELYETAS